MDFDNNIGLLKYEKSDKVRYFQPSRVKDLKSDIAPQRYGWESCNNNLLIWIEYTGTQGWPVWLNNLIWRPSNIISNVCVTTSNIFSKFYLFNLEAFQYYCKCICNFLKCFFLIWRPSCIISNIYGTGTTSIF